MIRIVLINLLLLLLLLLPLIVYFTYVALRQQNQPGAEMLANAPIFWLLAAGAGLMLIAIVILGQWETGSISGHYVPPHIKDGVVVPGHIE
ncbi:MULTISPECIES: DUF6111 family protein [Rhodomicrobium]|uniref:DUF6111 family protein n=1 Tax=Rhodomicrobium TaxID=1068 RepID=UPI000B4B1650|nr:MULTISPECIES: DUF6111 family protein [Rhodomicrobium]